jgi:hypothetical protein
MKYVMPVSIVQSRAELPMQILEGKVTDSWLRTSSLPPLDPRD